MRTHRPRRAETAGFVPSPLYTLPLLLLLLLAAPTRAERPGDDDDEPPVLDVGPVVVTATGAERGLLEVPGNVTVIEREEIERSGVRSVPDLLRRQPGLFVTASTTNPAGVQVEARGFNNGGALGSSLLVQVDGRRANEADTANTDWALLPLEEIESIEIVRGPASALYGDNAVGGVINIRTRPLEGPPRARLTGRIGRYDTGGGSLNAAGTAGPVTGSIFTEGLTTDGYRHGSDFDRQVVKGSLQANLGERVLVGISGGRYYDERDFPGFLTEEQIRASGRRIRNPASSADGSEVERYFVDGWLEAVPVDNVALRIRPYWLDRDDATTITFSEGGGTLSNEVDKTSIGVNAQLQVDRALFGRRNRLIVGFDFLQDTTERSDLFTSGFGDSVTYSDNQKDVYAGFIQNEFNLTEKLLLSSGLRFDHVDYRLEIVDPALGAASDRPHFDIWSPKAALTWLFCPEFSAYLSYARGFRLPNFDENAPILAFDPGTPPTIPELEPQLSDSIELGAKYRGRRVDASLALYQANVRNEILLNPFVGFFGRNDNFGRVRHRGIEAALAVQIFDWLTGYANYTFEDVKVRKADGDPRLEGQRMTLTPRNRGTFGAFAQLPWFFEVTANVNVVGSRILSNDFLRAGSELDPYASFDLLLAFRPKFGEYLEGALTLALRNLSNEYYEDLGVRSVSSTTEGLYPAAGRTWEVGFMLTLRR